MKKIYNEICRLCLQITSDLLPMYGDDSNISAAILACTNVEVSDEDGYPKNICHRCMERLNDAFLFKQQCENSDAILKQATNEYFDSVGILNNYENEEICEENKTVSLPACVENEFTENIDEQFEIVYEIDDDNDNDDEIYQDVQYLKTEDESYMVEMPDESSFISNSFQEDEIEIKVEHDSSDEITPNADIDDQEYNNPDEVEKSKNQIKSTAVKKYSCFFCGETFQRESDLRVHKKTHSGPFQCRTCDLEFPNLWKQYNHEKIHDSDRTCKICGKVFKKRYRLMNHMLIHSDNRERAECDICYKTFSSIGNLNKHKITHSKVKPFQCPKCDKSFTQSYSLKLHMDVHLPPDETPYNCTLCSLSFRQMHALRNHIAIDHEENPLKQISFLKNASPVQCEVCNKFLSSTKTLQFHMRIHENVRQFVCRFCGKGFVFKNGMVSHERIHTSEKPFKCKFCGKGFRQKMGLHIHLRVHTGEKPYKCEICGKSFTQFSHLRSHLFVHTGEKRYACTLCDKKFSLSEGLRYHMMTHTGETPHKCPMCDKGFYIPYKLKVHMRKRHNIETDVDTIRKEMVSQ